MEINLTGRPAFTYVNVDLQPGETIIAEADAMASMAAELTMEAKMNGGFFGGLVKKYVGGESFFVNHITNNSSAVKRITLTQPTPGDMKLLELNGDSYCLQGGAYVASTPGVKLGVKWAGMLLLLAAKAYLNFKFLEQEKYFLVPMVHSSKKKLMANTL